MNPYSMLRTAMAALCLAPALSGAADPAWWNDPSTRIWKSTPQNSENWHPINLGQLKHVTMRAKAFLDLRLAAGGGAGAVINTLCAAFTESGSNSDNFAPVRVGQLKHVSSLFYNRLREAGYHWPTKNYSDTPPTFTYPWSESAPDTVVIADNAAPVNIGQLKHVFSFDVDTSDFLTSGGDVPSWWKKINGLTSSNNGSTQDPDGDGLTNLQEWQLSSTLGLVMQPNNTLTAAADSRKALDIPTFDNDRDGLPNEQDAVPDDPALTFPAIPETRYVMMDLGSGIARFINESGQVLRGWKVGTDPQGFGGDIVGEVLPPFQKSLNGAPSIPYSGPGGNPTMGYPILSDLLGLDAAGNPYVLRNTAVTEWTHNINNITGIEQYEVFRPRVHRGLAPLPAAGESNASGIGHPPFNETWPWHDVMVSANGAGKLEDFVLDSRSYVTAAGAFAHATQKGNTGGPDEFWWCNGPGESHITPSAKYKLAGLWWLPNAGAPQWQNNWSTSLEITTDNPIMKNGSCGQIESNPSTQYFSGVKNARWISVSREGDAIHASDGPPENPQTTYRFVNINTNNDPEEVDFNGDEPFLIASVPASVDPASPSKGPVVLATKQATELETRKITAWVRHGLRNWSRTILKDKNNRNEPADFLHGTTFTEVPTDPVHPLWPLNRRASVGTARGEFLLGNYLWRNGGIRKIDDLITYPANYSGFVASDMNAKGIIAGTVQGQGGGFRAAILVPVEVKAHPILADGSISPQSAPMELSMSSPTINLTTLQILGIRQNSNGSLVGDVRIEGQIKSEFCDTIKGDMGKIDTAQLIINENEENVTAITITSSKGESGPVGRPYPFTGTIAQTITVPLSAGDNTIKLSAKDKVYKIPGYSSWNVKINPIVSNSGTDTLYASDAVLAVELPLEQSLTDAETIKVTFSANANATQVSNVTFARTGIQNVFTANIAGILHAVEFQSISFPSASASGQAEVIYRQGSITAPGWRIPVVNAPATRHLYAGSYQSYTFPGGGGIPPDLALAGAVASVPVLAGMSSGGMFHSYVFEIVCPIPVPAGGTTEIKLGTDDFTLTQRMQNGQAVPNSYWLKEKDDTSKHPIVSNRVDPNPTPLNPDEAAMRDSLKNRSFEFGFIRGIGVGGKEMVVGTVKAGVGFVKWATDGLLLGSVLFNIVIKDAVGAPISEGEMQYAEMLNGRNEGINNAVVGLAQGLYKIYLWYVNNQINNARMTVAFLTGDDAGFDASIMRTNELNSEIFEKGAEVISHTLEEFKLDPDGVKGYKVGRVVFEILSIVFPAGQLAKVSKLEFLQTIVTKTTSLGGATILKLTEVIEPLRIGKFCFVSGTKVLVKDGLKNIEAIRPGDIVCSRDEFTMGSDWRPVHESFGEPGMTLSKVTQIFQHEKEAVFQIYYGSRKPPQDIKPITLSRRELEEMSRKVNEGEGGSVFVTAEHPYYVLSRSKFVPVSGLQDGDRFRDFEGKALVFHGKRLIRSMPGAPFKVHNIEVADSHTYFAGKESIWVHNLCSEAVERYTSIFLALRRNLSVDDALKEALRIAVYDHKISTEEASVLARSLLLREGRSHLFDLFDLPPGRFINLTAASAGDGRSFITYAFKNADGQVIYVGRASGAGNPAQVLEGRLSRGHDHFHQGLTAEVVDVQKSKLANQGAEEFFIQAYREIGSPLTNIDESLSFSNIDRSIRSITKLDTFFEELFAR